MQLSLKYLFSTKYYLDSLITLTNKDISTGKSVFDKNWSIYILELGLRILIWFARLIRLKVGKHKKVHIILLRDIRLVKCVTIHVQFFNKKKYHTHKKVLIWAFNQWKHIIWKVFNSSDFLLAFPPMGIRPLDAMFIGFTSFLKTLCFGGGGIFHKIIQYISYH